MRRGCVMGGGGAAVVSNNAASWCDCTMGRTMQMQLHLHAQIFDQSDIERVLNGDFSEFRYTRLNPGALSATACTPARNLRIALQGKGITITGFAGDCGGVMQKLCRAIGVAQGFV